MKKMLLAAGVAIASCTLPLDAKAASFTGLTVLGDSLADSGNLFNLTSALSVFGVPALPPSPPYAQRNSNGPIWIDNVGQALGLSPTLITDLLLDPTTPPPTQGINFAFAGSLSSDIHILDDDLPLFADLFPGFQDQIDTFTELAAVVPPDPNALYVIWVGANDYNEAFFSPATLGGRSLDQLPDFVTDNIIDGLAQLSSLGANEFLVANLPPIGEAPFADFLDNQTPQDISTQLNQLSAVHNELLATKLSDFSQRQPDTNIISLDINSLFVDVLADPGAFGLTNVTDSCLTNFQPGFQFDGVCDNPDEFLFWDDVHPTEAAYQLVSDLALATLNEDEPPAGVPEPSSLAALLGMGLMFLRTLSLSKTNSPQ
ncbi:MAG: SGNH/GDSL hydrolase family protein [Cyanobacteria bacterium P01_A01_bin.114]